MEVIVKCSSLKSPAIICLGGAIFETVACPRMALPHDCSLFQAFLVLGFYHSH